MNKINEPTEEIRPTYHENLAWGRNYLNTDLDNDKLQEYCRDFFLKENPFIITPDKSELDERPVSSDMIHSNEYRFLEDIANANGLLKFRLFDMVDIHFTDRRIASKVKDEIGEFFEDVITMFFIHRIFGHESVYNRDPLVLTKVVHLYDHYRLDLTNNDLRAKEFLAMIDFIFGEKSNYVFTRYERFISNLFHPEMVHICGNGDVIFPSITGKTDHHSLKNYR